MKVLLITRHSVPNYGSLLQTIATTMAIENLNCTCEIINYVRKDEKANNICLALLKRNKKWNRNIFRKLIFILYNGINYQMMYRIFYIKNRHLLKNKTEEYNSLEGLTANPPKGDVYCSGSDQLWGSIGSSEYDPAYFLNFVPSDKKCISYASSFGSDVVNKNLICNLPMLLGNYKHISVREKSAQDILNGANIDSKLVLDPTFLIDRQRWINVFKLKKRKEKYILVYQLHNNKNFDNYVKKLSATKQLKIHRITSTLYNITKKGKIHYLPKASGFLELIYNAEYIVTDSFHGTVFSIIFNKTFLSVNPGVTSTRIECLLQLFNIKDRLLKNYNDLDNIDYNINWNSVNKLVYDLREQSIDWLKNSIYK